MQKETKPSRVKTYKPFPLATLPPGVRDFVEHVAATTQTDSTAAGIACLAALAGLIGSKRLIQVTPEWTEPAYQWLGLVGYSGDGKTNALKKCLAPIKKMQAEYEQTYREQYTEWQETSKKERTLAEPQPKILITCSGTLEGLSSRLRHNPDGFLLHSDELSGWLKSHGEYKGGGGSDAEVWIRLHDGDGLSKELATDRLYVARGGISIIGGIQPAILQKQFTEERLASGLAGRFLLAAPPDRKKKLNSEPIPPHIKERMAEVYKRLENLEPAHDDFKYCEPTAAAAERFKEFYNRSETQRYDLPPGIGKSLVSKRPRTAARFCLILHLAAWAEGKIKSQYDIEPPTMDAAIHLAEWFTRETRRVIDKNQPMQQFEPLQAAAIALEAAGREGCSPRQLHRDNRRLFPTSGDAEKTLNGLVHREQAHRIEATGSPGRPSTVYRWLPHADDEIGDFKPTEEKTTPQNGSVCTIGTESDL